MRSAHPCPLSRLPDRGRTDVTIVQMFDQPFRKITAQLPRLRRFGFSHVLVSPPQKSHSSLRWWGRYQPVDFTRIEGPLGDHSDLQALCQAARDHGMAIVADTVLHHLSNESRYVRIRGNRILSAQYPFFHARDLAGVHRLGRGRGLPILDSRSAWVRQQWKEYLRRLFDLGVRGFRFDSAKHMEPHLFPHLLEGLPPLLVFGELVYAHAAAYPPEYWRSMKAYDFPLARALRSALAPGGDLGGLLTPDALWGPLSVPFVNHHDLVKNRRAFADFRVADRRDRALAYAFMLARGEGTPLVYGGDLRFAEVKAGLRFHNASAGLPLVPLQASRAALAFRRGEAAICAINKGAAGLDFSGSARPGLYRDEVTGTTGSTSHGQLRWRLPPRSAALLVKVD